MVGPLLEAGVDKRVIDVVEPTPPESTSRALCYPNLAIISPELIPHNVLNCAWKICSGKEWLFYATDCATLNGIEAKDYDYYFIERNYEDSEIEARIAAKHAAGEFAYEIEARRNHLSEEQALDWLAANMGPNSLYVPLHQHQEKNRRISK